MLLEPCEVFPQDIRFRAPAVLTDRPEGSQLLLLIFRTC
jgi:hypothetical protein